MGRKKSLCHVLEGKDYDVASAPTAQWVFQRGQQAWLG